MANPYKLKSLREFQQELARNPYRNGTSNGKISKGSTYGDMSNTSRYRQQRVAETTLSVTQMDGMQQAVMLYEAESVEPMERVRKDMLVPRAPRDRKGRLYE